MTAFHQSTGLYLHQAKNFQLETRPLETPGDNEVQVAIRSTTLCGSDLHYYQHFRNGDIHVQEPLCLGHESAGEIVAVGAAVVDLQIGDAVALEVGVPCDNCETCQSARYNLCPSLRFRSSGSKFPHYQGTLQQYVTHPAKWVYKLPDELKFEIGALLEPLSVAIQAIRKITSLLESASKRGCLIFGAGPIGLLVSLAAQASGLRKICIADIDQGRLNFARENGFATATYTVSPKRGENIQDKLNIAREVSAGIGDQLWDDGTKVGKMPAVFECTGVESCLQASIYSTSSGGSVVMLGLGVPIHTLPISEATAREISLVPTWRYSNTYPEAISIAEASVTGMKRNGVLLPDIRKLLTHNFHGLEMIGEAFRVAGQTKDDTGAAVVKVAISF